MKVGEIIRNIMKKKLIVLSGIGSVVLPILAFAQGAGNTGVGCGASGSSVQPGTFQSILCNISSVMNTLIPILIVLGVVYFIWGVVTYMIGDDEEAKAKGKNRIIYGIIGLVVIVAMWGLVSIVTKSFGLDNNPTSDFPCVPGTGDPRCP